MNSQIITAETTASFQPGGGSTIPAESTGGARGGDKGIAAERKSEAQILCEGAINRLADALEAGRGDAARQSLGVMSRFHRYSFCNQLLILGSGPSRPTLPDAGAGGRWGGGFARTKRPPIFSRLG